MPDISNITQYCNKSNVENGDARAHLLAKHGKKQTRSTNGQGQQDFENAKAEVAMQLNARLVDALKGKALSPFAEFLQSCNSTAGGDT